MSTRPQSSSRLERLEHRCIPHRQSLPLRAELMVWESNRDEPLQSRVRSWKCICSYEGEMDGSGMQPSSQRALGLGRSSFAGPATFHLRYGQPLSDCGADTSHAMPNTMRSRNVHIGIDLVMDRERAIISDRKLACSGASRNANAPLASQQETQQHQSKLRKACAHRISSQRVKQQCIICRLTLGHLVVEERLRGGASDERSSSSLAVSFQPTYVFNSFGLSTKLFRPTSPLWRPFASFSIGQTRARMVCVLR